MIHPTLFRLCVCGHQKRDHIYHEGACRPGFECVQRCDKFETSAKHRFRSENASRFAKMSEADIDKWVEELAVTIRPDYPKPLKKQDCDHTELVAIIVNAMQDPRWDGIVICRFCGLHLRKA